LNAFILAQLSEKRVRRKVELERVILGAESKTELARFEAEAEIDRTARVAQYLKECSVKDEALEGSGRWIQNYSEITRANTMTPVVASLEQPKVELCYFAGNPAHYWKFVRQFEAYVESKVEDPGKDLYLTHYFSADERAAMEECVMLPSMVAYKRAREILGDFFGQPHIVARSFLEGQFSQARQTTYDKVTFQLVH
ncbi:unnamed protein product, partial [Schistocephalus solidus]|uniref:Helitron_like_N domain-containing protein n=1 Tax=Schistocephalus solidus TaxID=70667 RepID=A0A183SA65_SCHSO